MDSEIALEFLLRPEDLGPLRRLPTIKRLASKRAYTRQLNGVYFDTAGRLLHKNHITLGVQKSGQRHIQSVTSGETRVGPIVVRNRCESLIATETPDPYVIDEPDLMHFIGRFSANRLRKAFHTEFKRTTYRLNLDEGGEAILDIDCGEIIAGSTREPLNEARLSLMKGEAHQLLDLAQEILSSVPVRVAVAGRVERGLALLEGGAPAWKKNTGLDLSDDAAFEEALVHTVHHCLKHLLANEACVLESDDPEGVHQMRVALRRLLSALRLFRSVLPPEQCQHIAAEVKWLIDQLAATRDWDVFLEEIVAPAAIHSEEKKAFTVLLERTQEARMRSRETMRQAILSGRYTKFLLQVGAWTAKRAWRDQPLTKTSALIFAPVTDHSDKLIATRHKKVVARGRRFKTLTVPERHQLRIRVKKLRYSVDFFSSLYPLKRVKPYAARLSKLQDSLGYLNDVAVAENLVSRLAAQLNEEDALQCQRAGGIVIGWHAHALAQTEKTLRKDVKDFIKSKRFWR